MIRKGFRASRSSVWKVPIASPTTLIPVYFCSCSPPENVFLPFETADHLSVFDELIWGSKAEKTFW